ncbi:hypothetical protein Glove_22g106 [Diversispora epigaea]|uniref:HMA domain-containing protein n=1 Tax=Diversispora epigaea TaxID=1348612 RepID=A0A397JRD5_9GLOM|nr:hypothetical protein Glove_22g106 [Diversispora epigaea]
MPVYKFEVEMTCDGCIKAVTDALTPIAGTTFTADLGTKNVTVNSTQPLGTIKSALEATGRTVKVIP